MRTALPGEAAPAGYLRVERFALHDLGTANIWRGGILNATRCFGAALNFMIREQQRYFRHPVEILATLLFGEGQKLKARITNISEGGMAITFGGKLPMGSVSANFKLPGSATPLEPKGQIAWKDDSGRAGLRFIDVPRGSQEQLDQWLTEQCEKTEKRDEVISPFYDRRKADVHLKRARLKLVSTTTDFFANKELFAEYLRVEVRAIW